MTLSQMSKKVDLLRRQIEDLRESIDYELAVEGIKRGLASIPKQQSKSVRDVFDSIRRRHKGRRR
jgi:hypothetical protein